MKKDIDWVNGKCAHCGCDWGREYQSCPSCKQGSVIPCSRCGEMMNVDDVSLITNDDQWLCVGCVTQGDVDEIREGDVDEINGFEEK